MKDSKEKEHRISNLKNMITNVKEDDIDSIFEEIEEDDELIEYLNEETDDGKEFEINDEFIYHPGDEGTDAINLEENPIDEEYIIKTPKTEDSEDGDNVEEFDAFNEDIMGDISENFDTVINAKIGGKPILAIVSSIVGVILMIISVFIFQSRSDRVVDNVVAGESSFMFVIFFIFGLLLIIYGGYKLLNISNPFSKFTGDIDSIDDENKTDETKPEQPSPKVIPKSEIPLDKDSYKIGEFNMDDLKSSLKKPADSKNKLKVKEDLNDDSPSQKPAKKKTPTIEEVEEMEYERVKLDTESIDDIFAEVEDIEDLPIISIDSKEEKEK